MTTEWIRKHVRPGLVSRYEIEMAKLRGDKSSAEHVVNNINHLNEEIDQIETDEERHARELEEDAAMEEYLKKQRGYNLTGK